MTARLAALAAAVALGASDGPSLEREAVDGATRLSLAIPGPAREPALVRGPGGTDLVLLAHETHLWRWRGEAVETLREDLPEETAGLLPADVDGDGQDDLALFVPGRVLLLRAGPDARYAGPLETLVEDPDLDLGPGDLVPPSAATFQPGRVCASVLGALRCWSGMAGALPWARTVDVPLPIALTRAREGLRLTGIPVQRLPGTEAVFAAGFMAEGPERLRVLLIDPDAPAETRAAECWVRLPGHERVLEHAFLRLDGQPALAVTTLPANSFTLFGEKRLRVWLLAADRTRTGRTPLLAVSSSMNLWQAAHLFTEDLDGDGRQDLVLGYWKGLKDSRVVLETWLRRADGTFARGSAGAAFDVEDGSRTALRWGTDADGDGRPDLLLLAGGGLQVHPGATGKSLVSRQSARRVSLPGVGEGPDMEVSLSAGPVSTFPLTTPREDRIRPVDLDGDGRPEWLLVGSTLTLVRFPR